MNTALWVVQGLLAFVMFATGMLKIVVPRVKLAAKLKWAASWTDGSVKLLGLAEALGAIGLVVPWLTAILPVLTPIAAACLVVIMAGAVKTHVDLREPAIGPAILGLLGVFVALGRFGLF